MCISPLIVLEYFDTRHRAIDAISLTWDNSHLKLILAHDNLSASNEPHSTNNINTQGQPLWHGKYCESNLFFFFSLSLSRKLKKGTRKGIFNGHVAAKASALLSFLTLSRHLIIAHTTTQSNVCVCLVICTFAPSLCVFDSSFLFLFHFFFYLSVCCGHLIRFIFSSCVNSKDFYTRFLRVGSN